MVHDLERDQGRRFAMARQHQGAHLVLLGERRRPDGSLKSRSVWTIYDGVRRISTGCPPDARQQAELRLAEYIQKRAEAAAAPKAGPGLAVESKDPKDIPIAYVLLTYVRDKEEDGLVSIVKTKERVRELAMWWRERPLSDINGQSCREYMRHRLQMPWRNAKPEKTGKPPRMMSKSGVRRELEDLRAAVNHYIREGLCDRSVEVWLPDRGETRERFLDHSEAARLLWSAWTKREMMRRHHHNPKAKQEPTKKLVARHIARFILVGLYTGTRAGAICAASFWPEEGRSWVDVDNGLFYRLAQGKKRTNKRQPPVRLDKRLQAHLTRWRDMAAAEREAAAREGREPRFGNAVVEWNGKPIVSVKTGFASVVRAAGLDPTEVTPHTLRHTAATWMMASGRLTIWDCSAILGMSAQTLERVYGHHRPDFQQAIHGAIKASKRP